MEKEKIKWIVRPDNTNTYYGYIGKLCKYKIRKVEGDENDIWYELINDNDDIIGNFSNFIYADYYANNSSNYIEWEVSPDEPEIFYGVVNNTPLFRIEKDSDETCYIIFDMKYKRNVEGHFYSFHEATDKVNEILIDKIKK